MTSDSKGKYVTRIRLLALGGLAGVGLFANPAAAQGTGTASGEEGTSVAPAPSSGGEKTAPQEPSSAPAAAVAPPSPGNARWYDSVDVGAFVDTYYSFNYGTPKPEAGSNKFRAFDTNNGFSLSWAGVDIGMAPEPVGGAVQLRFGPSMANLAVLDNNGPGGIGYVQNAYLAWRPGGKTGKFTLYGGKFDTVFGAEVAQSHLNMNYTRGALYNLGQPFFHTGLRGELQATETLTLKVLAVNGWNNTLDNNGGKSFGAQVAFTPTESLGLAAGYLGGPEQADTALATPPGGSSAVPTRVAGANSRWRHLADAIVDIKPTADLRILANGTFVTEELAVGSQKWYGASLMGRYGFSEVFAMALRGEYIGDPDGALTAQVDGTLITGTLTFEVAPSRNLLFRLDQRIDAMNKDVFQESYDKTSKTQITSTLGMVVKTN